MPRRLLVILVAALTLGLAAVAHAATKTTLRITKEADHDGLHRVSGFVISTRTSCHSGRKVILYRMRGSRPNVRRDKYRAFSTATPNGDGSQYFIDFQGKGTYYTYVKATKSCGGAYSKLVKYKS